MGTLRGSRCAGIIMERLPETAQKQQGSKRFLKRQHSEAFRVERGSGTANCKIKSVEEFLWMFYVPARRKGAVSK